MHIDFVFFSPRCLLAPFQPVCEFIPPFISYCRLSKKAILDHLLGLEGKGAKTIAEICKVTGLKRRDCSKLLKELGVGADGGETSEPSAPAPAAEAPPADPPADPPAPSDENS